MKGSNTLVYNLATMIDAMEEYINKRYRAPDGQRIIVKDVKSTKGGMCPTFDILVETAKEASTNETV